TPPNLGEALKMARDGTPLPGQFLEAYLRLKEREWEEYIKAEGSWETTWNKITKWEYEKYLEEA
ncbi:MAG: glutamine synthetase, partial [Pyrobaculum aerophilum]|nr:glutamine synthetase [Pyrobaculum aerophilum]